MIGTAGLGTNGIRVYIRHVREEMLCTRGLRAWLLHHEFSVADFVRDGMPVERAEATGDAFALRVCARARAEFGKGL